MSLFYKKDIDLKNIYIKPNIYNVLNEARGISMDCNIEANKIATALRSIVNKSDNFSYLTKDNARIGILRKGQEMFDVFGMTLFVKWEFYNFDDKKWLDKYYETIPKNDYFDADKNLMSVTLFGVSGNLNVRNCENTIAHEIFHNYKSFKPINKKEHNLAKVANKVATAKSKSGYTELIGIILYLLSKEEIQAFCNGAYAQIKKEILQGNRRSLEEFIENTILYENFIEVDYLINDFKTRFNERIYNKCRNEIKALTNHKMMSYNSFIKYMEEGRKNYIYQIGRLKSILIDDFKLEESSIIFEKYF